MTGLDFYLDPAVMDAHTSAHVRAVLQNAIATLDKHRAKSTDAV